MKKLCVLLILLILPFGIISCNNGSSSLQNVEYEYREPEQTGDGWTTADLTSMGIDVAGIEEMIRSIKAGASAEIHSVLIVMNGDLVLEEYFPGYQYAWNNFNSIYINYNRDTLHYLASATKSFGSALIGIAIYQGLISGVEDSLYGFFPQYSHLNNYQKSQITLHHTLTMTAGFSWNENSVPYTSLNSDIISLVTSDDWYGYILSKNISFAPGLLFYYNSGLSVLLGGIIQNVYGASGKEFADNYLFGPLNIDSYIFQEGPNGELNTGGGLWLRPRDMAKFGQLFLNKGIWNGTRIISEEWINDSTAKHVAFDSTYIYPETIGYGYQWWLYAFEVDGKTYKAYTAVGWGGQNIIVFEELDLVVVFTGGNYLGSYYPTGLMYLNSTILPAILGRK
jgi:CubicO group peptidase (beta-lactamase class C family)